MPLKDPTMYEHRHIIIIVVCEDVSHVRLSR